MNSRTSPTAAAGARWRHALIGLVVAVLGAGAAWGDDTVAGAGVVVLGPGLETRTQIAAGWRYAPGDDLAWADPDLDDSGWPIVDSLLQDPPAMPGGWSGIGWFRQRIRLADGLPSTAIALRVMQAGASEVYLDGVRVVAFGQISTATSTEQPFYPNHFVGVVLERGREHVLAVRYSNRGGQTIGQSVRGFVVNLRSVESASRAALEWSQLVTVVPAASAAALGSIALVHALLWLFDRSRRDDFKVALFASGLAAQIGFTTAAALTADTMQASALDRLAMASMVVALACGIVLVRALLGHRAGLPWWAVGVAGLALVLSVDLWPVLREPWLWEAFVGVTAAEMVRLTLAGMLGRHRREAWIAAAGILPFAGLLAATPVLQLARAPQPPRWLAVTTLVLVVVSFSVSLSRRAARTGRELESRLEEVESLSAKSLEQERRALREEGERRLLESEHARRGRELEIARRLQLAMLPPPHSDLGRVDLAFRMITATEVGGDYVDLRRLSDDATLIAVGDATSHGLHAGMVVAVAKSLFLSASDDAPLAVLGRVGAGLQEMRERHASMALAVLRFEPGRLRVASAGMPPLLVHRRASGTVEEVLVAGVPLGTLSQARHQERSVPLEIGDTVLVMSDGLVEASDPAGEPVGYLRVADLLRSLAGRSAAEVVDGLLAAATAHLGGRPPADDITIVALVSR